MTTTHELTRRRFVQIVSVAGGGLLLGVHLPDPTEVEAQEPAAGFAPNAFLRIDADGRVTVVVARSELGQGARTAVAMLVAEELEADWTRIRIEPAIADRKYGSMTTGGSSTVRGGWEPLRRAGATGRVLLVAAAAHTWGVPPAECRAENGAVVHTASGRRLDYGALAATAAGLPVPTDVPLKEPSAFRLIGTSPPRLDLPDKVTGAAIFGLDVRRPGMLFASVERCPVFGGKTHRFEAGAALATPGVRRVIEIPTGVAVLADSTWAALQGRARLRVEWDPGPNADLDSARLRDLFAAHGRGAGVVVRQEGDAERALAQAARRVEAVYELPFLAHATLEPMNCTAEVREGEAEIWAPTQAPAWAWQAAAAALELPPERVVVHTTLSGGAFGRRLMFDFVVEAVRLSKAAGAPVQVVWTREDDLTHDYYRPASLHRLAAGLDADGRLVAWTHRVVAPSITAYNFPDEKAEEPDLVDGAAQLPYAIPNLTVEAVQVETPVPVGWWRSVYNTQNAFANEAFLDEIAAALHADPLELRLRLLPEASRLRRPLETAARRAGWGTPAPAGRFRGLACHTCFGSSVAEVAEVSVDERGQVRVHRVVAGLDCGPCVHPDCTAAQVEGAVALGLSAVLNGEITLAGGRVQQTNFDAYPMLDFRTMPDVEAHMVPSAEAIGGVGEPGLPPLAPAVCNAVFAATGRRVRRLPIRPEDLRRT